MNKKRPNVIFVLTDDQGYPALGCNGHPFVKTPKLDEFAEESIRFEDFHCGTTCAPTRSGLLTGHYCNSTGVWHTVGGRSLLRKDEWTLADALAENGYETAIFGKWHLGDDIPYRPQDRGFKTTLYHGGGMIGDIADAWGNDYFDDVYEFNGEKKQFNGYCTDVFFSEAMKFIEKNKDKPFFCFIPTNAPHGPWNVEKKYVDMYKDKCDSENYARFLGMISNIDDNFGKLRAKLAKLEIEDNTLIVFMSDNGQTNMVKGYYNSGMRGLKCSQYEGGHRVPFFARWADGGLLKGRRIDELTSYVDFMPTVLDICGCEVPVDKRPFHGESLMPLLKSEKPREYWDARTVVTDTQRTPYPLKYQRSCVMKKKWRLINCKELYNLETDPGQKDDISAQYPELVEELSTEYEKWWDICSEQFHTDTPISIGNFKNRINAMDMRDEAGTVICGQKMVRQGKHGANGYYPIYVEEDGVYELELCRWPEEVDAPLKGKIPEGHDVDFYREGIAEIDYENYSGSNELPIDFAQLQIKDVCIEAKPVNNDDRSIRFEVKLQGEKEYELRAFFYNENFSDYNSTPFYIYTQKLQ